MSDVFFDSLLEELDNFSLNQCITLLSRLTQVLEEKKNKVDSPRKNMYGVWKNDSFYMSPDFDEPLDDFSEYM